MLTLPEELLLLALNDKTGTNKLGAYLDQALLAAALLDLVLQGHIVRREREPGMSYAELYSLPAYLDEDLPRHTYHLSAKATTTGSAYLDHVLMTIENHQKTDRLHSFTTLALFYLGRTDYLNVNVNANPPDQRLLAAHDLLGREQLIETESRFLFVRNIRLPQGNRSTGENELRFRLIRSFQDGFPQPDERLRALLLLIKSTGLIAEVWGKEQFDAADWRIAQILRLTMEPGSLLADAYQYIIFGSTGAAEAALLKTRIPPPP